MSDPAYPYASHPASAQDPYSQQPPYGPAASASYGQQPAYGQQGAYGQQSTVKIIDVGTRAEHILRLFDRSGTT